MYKVLGDSMEKECDQLQDWKKTIFSYFIYDIHISFPYNLLVMQRSLTGSNQNVYDISRQKEQE